MQSGPINLGEKYIDFLQRSLNPFSEDRSFTVKTDGST